MGFVGFSKGGRGVWQPPHVSAAKTRKAKRQQDGLDARLQSAVSVPCNCRLPHICLLFCVMQRCLLHKIVDRQDKSDEVGDQSSEGARACYRLFWTRCSPETL